MYFTGAAPLQEQIALGKIGTYDAASTYKLAVNQRYVSVIAEGDATQTAAGLIELWNAETNPEMSEITASSSGVSVTLTGDVEGTPFTATLTVSGGTGSVTAFSNTQEATGPHSIHLAANWSGNATPGNSDTLHFTGNIPPVKWHCDQLSSVTGLTVYIYDVPRSFYLGLPPVNNTNGIAEYPEYRPQYATFKGATLIQIDAPDCGMIRINSGSAASVTLNCNSTGSPLVENLPALTFVGAHASNLVNIGGGSVGIAVRPTETATIVTMKVANNLQSNANVEVGIGSTLTTVTVAGGTLETQSGCTTLTAHGGSVITRNSAAITTANVRADGHLTHKSSGTIGTLNAGPAGHVDFRQDIRARTVTTCNAYSGTEILDSLGTVTWSNGIVLQQCGLGDVTIDVGSNRTIGIT